MSLTESAKSRIEQYWDKKGKLTLWAGTIANRSLQAHELRQDRNKSAEDASVRRAAWGENAASNMGTARDDMGHTILGDVNHPAPIVITQPPSNGLGKMLAGAAIAAGLIGVPGAGVAGYLLSQAMQRPAATQVQDDNSVDVGLKRLSDLIEK